MKTNAKYAQIPPATVFALAVGLSLVVAAPDVKSDSPQKSSAIVIQGKVYCSVKRPLVFPYGAIITAVPVKPGQAIKAGEVLVRYRLPPAASLELHRRLDNPQIGRLEMELAELDLKQVEADSALRELERLAAQNMAPTEEVGKTRKRIELLGQQRAALQKQIALEKRLVAEDRALLKELLGAEVSADSLPEQAALVAPLDGNVVVISPDVRVNAEIPKNAPALTLGVLDPMYIRGQIHEIEAVQVQPGDQAEFTIQAIPGRKFTAEVRSLAWAPLPTDRLETPTYYEIELIVGNPDSVLREGLKAEITLHGTRKTK
jgi:HlyD family secretion protein